MIPKIISAPLRQKNKAAIDAIFQKCENVISAETKKGRINRFISNTLDREQQTVKDIKSRFAVHDRQTAFPNLFAWLKDRGMI